MTHLSNDFHPILTTSVIKILNSKQIFTVTDFIRTEIKIIEKHTNLTFVEILNVRKSLLNKFSAVPRNGLEYYKYALENSAIISTGIKSIDTILDGGLFTGNIYEISGLSASGKTLFCLTIVKNVTKNLKQNILYLDTKRNFFGTKLKQTLNDLNKEDLIEAMNKCLVQKINSKYQLLECLQQIKNDLEIASLKVRVIIIDSLPGVFLNYSLDHSENNSVINRTVNIMRMIACEHHVVFVITNLITRWNPGDFQKHQRFVETIACGKYWSSIPNFKLTIRKTEDCSGEIVLKRSNLFNECGRAEIRFEDNGLV